MPPASSSTASGLPEGALPRWQRWAVGVAALVWVGLTVWQIAAGRDDWPLSAFEMYSRRQGAWASRNVLRGVSDVGEFELEGAHLAPFGGARLRHLNAKLGRQPKRQARFVATVRRRYDEQREERQWPLLQAVRAYSEVWKIRPGLAGIERPKRRLTGALYLPPQGLLERLEAERQRSAAVLQARPRSEGDVVVEWSAEHCAGERAEPSSDGAKAASACRLVSDRHASSGVAVALSRGATLQTELELPPGRWSIFVRMLVTGKADRLRVAVNGKRLGGKKGIGNYRRALGAGGWVWASSAPGRAPLRLKVKSGAARRLSLEATGGGIVVDQLWLSRAQRELPVSNEAVQP